MNEHLLTRSDSFDSPRLPSNRRTIKRCPLPTEQRKTSQTLYILINNNKDTETNLIVCLKYLWLANFCYSYNQTRALFHSFFMLLCVFFIYAPVTSMWKPAGVLFLGKCRSQTSQPVFVKRLWTLAGASNNAFHLHNWFNHSRLFITSNVFNFMAL